MWDRRETLHGLAEKNGDAPMERRATSGPPVSCASRCSARAHRHDTFPCRPQNRRSSDSGGISFAGASGGEASPAKRLPWRRPRFLRTPGISGATPGMAPTAAKHHEMIAMARCGGPRSKARDNARRGFNLHRQAHRGGRQTWITHASWESQNGRRRNRGTQHGIG